MPNRYAKLSTEDFDRLLVNILNDHRAADLLAIPGIYEILAEEFNNAVLEAWELEQAEKAEAEE